MKIPNWLKIATWLALIALLTWLLSQRYYAIINGNSNTSDIIILLIWIALIAAIIFQEVDFFGVKIKKEIDELKTEFKEQINNLRTDIQNSISTNTVINPQINIVPPSDSDLANTEKQIRPILEQILKEKKIEPQTKFEPVTISDDVKYLFSIRFEIESELKRIWRETELEISLWSGKPIQPEIIPRTVLSMARGLAELRIIRSELVNLVRDINAVCSAAIHGEKQSDTAIKFVRDVAPGLIASLNAVSRLPSRKPLNKE